MQIENITKERLKGLPGKELYNLRFRCIQLFNRHFHNNSRTEIEGLERSILLEKNKIVLDEMADRKLKFKKESNLDRAIFKRDFLGLDVPGLGDIVLIKDCITATGSFLRDPKETKTIDIVIKKSLSDQDEEFDQKISVVIKEATGKSPNIIYKPEGTKLSHIPVFDLVLRAHEETKRMDVKKETEKKKMVAASKKVEEDLEKGALPFKDLGAAEESAAWNGPREMVKADVDDLRQMCAWYDSENPDIKASYKLPHHRYSDKKAVWRAVVAASAIIMGARGGTLIPKKDIPGVKNHLGKHYSQWDKTPPWENKSAMVYEEVIQELNERGAL